MAAAHLTELPPREILVGEAVLSLCVRQSTRARAMRLVVGLWRPLELTIPAGTPDEAIAAFVAEREAWIRDKVARAREIASRPHALGLERPGTVRLAGEDVPVRLHEPRDGVRSLARMRGGALVVCQAPERAGEAIERWYRREARRRLADVCGREAGRLGVSYRSLAVRDQKTRWGSCSSRGTLSFSWRLVVAPPEVLEYVAVHELCHLRVPNHTKAFWRVLDAARPGWQEQARWLREHGRELQAYRPARAVYAHD